MAATGRLEDAMTRTTATLIHVDGGFTTMTI
jgi:hypothetical protein